MEEMEQHNKEHLKETLKIKSKAHANELDIRGIQREVENIWLNWTLVMKNKVEHGNYIQIMKISNFETRQDESLVKIQW